MASGTATVSGKTGPGNTVTSASFPNISKIILEPIRQMLQVFYGNNQYAEVDYSQTTVLTDTISGATSTFVVS